MEKDRFQQDRFVRAVVICGRVLLYGPFVLALLWVAVLLVYKLAGGSPEQ